MIIDLLFPKFCIGCGFWGSYLCLRCQNKLISTEHDECLYCGKNSYFGYTHPVCRRHNGVDGFIYVYKYEGVLRKIIKNIKYRLVTDVFEEFVRIAPYTFIKKLNSVPLTNKWYLQSIPLYKTRERQRGFNQSDLFRDFIQKNTNNTTVVSALSKFKNTLPQAQLTSIKQKFNNIKGVFIANNKEVFGKKIILIDDVVTTGSTVKEACRILKKAGAQSVIVVSLARA